MGEGGRNRFASLDEAHDVRPAGPLGRVHRVRVGPGGDLALPAGLAVGLGLEPGAELQVVARGGRFELRPNIHSLARVYVEPTARCNLTCRTCVRNTWREPTGDMSPHLFERLLAQLGRFPHLRSVMFGGVGEPTAHPDIVAMIRGVKALGLRAELVTNGTLLVDAMADGIAASGLDMLWVSFDGATEASFAAIRDGASYASVVANVQRVRRAAHEAGRAVEIGIAFVVMSGNLGELRRIGGLIESLGASRVSVSNVLPYSAEMEKQMVCRVALALELHSGVPGKTEVDLPRIDVSRDTQGALLDLLHGEYNLSLMGNPVSTDIRSCRFVRDRCTFVRFDGKVAPCMGLLHAHTTFLHGNHRTIEPYLLGDLSDVDLPTVWGSAEYRAFREKVDAFDFSPCHSCGGCDLGDANREDCAGSTFPTCGGCLWAQGIIQCP